MIVFSIFEAGAYPLLYRLKFLHIKELEFVTSEIMPTFEAVYKRS